MPIPLPPWLQTWLERPPLAQIRRNHALEHATIHVLSQKYPGRAMAGYSDAYGFWLWTDLTKSAVQEAVQEAWDRMRRGETHLAVHPGCGTNYLTMGFLGSLVAMLTLGLTERRWRWWDRFSFLVPVLMFTLIAAQPLGHWLQAAITTSPDVADLEIVDIQAFPQGPRTVYRILTRWSPEAKRQPTLPLLPG